MEGFTLPLVGRVVPQARGGGCSFDNFYHTPTPTLRVDPLNKGRVKWRCASRLGMAFDRIVFAAEAMHIERPLQSHDSALGRP